MHETRGRPKGIATHCKVCGNEIEDNDRYTGRLCLEHFKENKNRNWREHRQRKIKKLDYQKFFKEYTK